MAPARSFIKLGALTAAAACAAIAALFLFNRAEAQQQSGWQVCNETSYVLEAATGRPDGRAILVQGWTRLRPGECRAVVTGALARGTHYLYARTSAAHRGGRRQWGGDARLCVDSRNQFSIENPPNCAVSGYEERRFRRVQINKRDTWRTSLAEAQPYTVTRARAAGLQRLLADAGYDLAEGRRGADPRRVAQAIAQFRTSARLPANASEDQLIDALETAARRRADQVGLTLCNRTNARMWTAVARRRGEGWESRGWWQLNPGGCVRTIDEVLIQEAYYVYASLEHEQGPRLLASQGEPFCTSPARFAILGRENCENRHYNTTIFTRIQRHDRQGLAVDLQNDDFLEPNAPARLAPNVAVRDAPIQQSGRPGFAPPQAQTQDRSAQ